MTDSTENFWWHSKSLGEMDSREWELLCDGCGRCCLNKIEYENGDIFYTDLACSYLDREECVCSDYANRTKNVSNCVALSPSRPVFGWLPATCAYRLLDEGKELYWWHHLVSGSRDTVHEAGVSVRGRCVSESGVSAEQYEDHIIDWIE